MTRRRTDQRAALEVEVLRALFDAGAPVPRVLAFDGTWLVQEDLGARRLSQVLAGATEAETERRLDPALFALARVHGAGRIAGLERRVVAIGNTADWLHRLIAAPERLGARLGLGAPTLDRDALAAWLTVDRPRFIKWDARPGNAAVTGDGVVAWFDWEHCGCRSPLDDLAWLLGDEYTPYWPAVEDRLLDRYVPAFAAVSDPEAARGYLGAFGTLHMCVRLALIVANKGDGPWWDAEYCLAHDKVGVTQEMARRTCERAGIWSRRSPLTAPLGPWLAAVAARVGGGA